MQYSADVVVGVLGAAEYKAESLRPGWMCFSGTGKGAFGVILVVLLPENLDNSLVQGLVGRFKWGVALLSPSKILT